MQHKKALVLFLLLVSACLVFAGGQKESGTEDVAAPEATVETGQINTVINGYDYGDTGGLSLPIVEEPIVVKALVASHPTNALNPDWPVWELLSEATNVRFDLLVVPMNGVKEKMQVLYNTGDLPDLIQVSSLDDINRLAVKGGIAAVSEYLDVMPNFKAVTVI